MRTPTLEAQPEKKMKVVKEARREIGSLSSYRHLQPPSSRLDSKFYLSVLPKRPLDYQSAHDNAGIEDTHDM